MNQPDPNLDLPPEPSETELGRRELLKALAVGGGAMAVSTILPGQWLKPVIEAGLLPAHALVSATPTATGTVIPACRLINLQISAVTDCDYSNPNNPSRSFTITSASFSAPTAGTSVSFAVNGNGMTATLSSGSTTTDGNGLASFNQVITLTGIPGNGGQASVTFTISDNQNCGAFTTPSVIIPISDCPSPRCTNIIPTWGIGNIDDGGFPFVGIGCQPQGEGTLVIQSAQVLSSPVNLSSGTVILTITSPDSNVVSVSSDGTNFGTSANISGTMDNSGNVTFNPDSFTLVIGPDYDTVPFPPTVTAAFTFNGSACGSSIEISVIFLGC